MTTVANNIKVADAMVSNIGLLFDGVGYDEQGYFAQLFMTSLAQTMTISSHALNGYVIKTQELADDVHWLTRQAEQNALRFIELVKVFNANKSDENANNIINYTK